MKTIIISLVLVLLIMTVPKTIFSQISDDDKIGLFYLLEEEKLAYDIYSEMYKKYNHKVFENIMVPMLINDHFKNRAEMKETAELLVQKVGLTHRIDHYPRELSGGEQQRTAIARALANNPDFILADEPTGNLDSKNERMIFEELKKLTELGKGVLVVSHNDAVTDFADRICVMKDGILEEN